MTDCVSYLLDDGVATITLANGKVNAVSHELIKQLNQALDRAEADDAVVILTGQAGILSAGYDLKVMSASAESARDLVTAGSTLARRMLAHPRPIIIACPGHAIAKGAFLLLSADYRIGVNGAFSIGLNEVQIGITMHHVGIELARDRLRKSVLNRSVINGEMFDPQSAVDAGFLDQVVEVDALMGAAREKAMQYKGLNAKAHAQTKLKVRKALLDTLDAAIELDKTIPLTIER